MISLLCFCPEVRCGIMTYLKTSLITIHALVCLSAVVRAIETDEVPMSDEPENGQNKKNDTKAVAPPGLPEKKPNIVFIFADDLGFHDIGYHASVMQTPTLDQLAEEGVKLESYYVQPSCSPSRCSLLSGRYLIRSGIQHNVFYDDQAIGLPLDSPTLPDKLKEAGYATHAVGKWHAGFYKKEYMPHYRGFDTFFGFLNGHEDHYDHSKAFKTKKYLDLRFNDTPLRNMSGQYSTHMYTERAQEIIASHDTSKPLFLYLSHQAVHSPMQVPEKYEDHFHEIADNRRRIYAGMLYALDEGVANVTRSLKERNMWKDTILIFSSDNGGAPKNGGNNYPLRGAKFSLWEGGIRAVGFVSGGENIRLARNTISTGLMHIADWYPTLLNIAGGNLNGTLPLDGVDNWKMLSEGAPSSRNVILHNIDRLQGKRGKKVEKYPFDSTVRSAIRFGDYKLITGAPGNAAWTNPPERTDLPKKVEPKSESKSKNIWLFNIVNDPQEKKDLSFKRPKLVRTMMNMLAEFDAAAVPAYYPKGNASANPRLHGGVWGPWWEE